MRWAEQVDRYCERLGPGLWAEPLNALTNAAFLIAALILWRRSAGMPVARVLSALLFVIGLGSLTFHTVATRWAGLVDTLPILAFILTYVWAANRHVLGWSPRLAALGAAGFVPWAAALTPLFAALPFFTVSSFYWSVPALILTYAAILWRRHPATARGFVLGAAILCLSLVFRSVDRTLCDHLPMGTHWAWHVLNAVMLGWMIHVLIAHRLAGPAPAR